jgi:hypothetical protein
MAATELLRRRSHLQNEKTAAPVGLESGADGPSRKSRKAGALAAAAAFRQRPVYIAGDLLPAALIPPYVEAEAA